MKFAARRFAETLKSFKIGESDLRIAALIVAAGRGTRAAIGGAGPKQYAVIGGRTGPARARFGASPSIPRSMTIKVVIHPDDVESVRSVRCPSSASRKLSAPAIGGATRQASVLSGLEALASSAPDFVLIHDAARPFVSPETISNVIAALR